MKSLISVCVVLFVMMIATPAMCDNGRVSPESLKALGLGSLDLLSDEDGMAVRGRRNGKVEYTWKIEEGTKRIKGKVKVTWDVDARIFALRSRFKLTGNFSLTLTRGNKPKMSWDIEQSSKFTGSSIGMNP